MKKKNIGHKMLLGLPIIFTVIGGIFWWYSVLVYGETIELYDGYYIGIIAAIIWSLTD